MIGTVVKKLQGVDQRVRMNEQEEEKQKERERERVRKGVKGHINRFCVDLKDFVWNRNFFFYMDADRPGNSTLKHMTFVGQGEGKGWTDGEGGSHVHVRNITLHVHTLSRVWGVKLVPFPC